MPTQNRRVATYLPSHIDEPFKAFKSQRDIKGDSEALIAILSEYFQVSQEVAYPSSSNLLQRIEAIEERLSSLKSELLSELKDELQKLSQPKLSKSKSRLPGDLQKELLISDKSPELVRNGSSLSESKIDSLVPLNGNQLSERFSLHKDSVAHARRDYKQNLNRFTEWSKAKDPDGFAWEYHEDDKLYHPV